ncbi:MAG: nitroreductase [Ruminococcaceae bacterium]|nr:nitroreductase [Oscillospiraceae bacterium]
MDILPLLRERFSVRDFSDRPVKKEDLDKILEAGRIAPTAKNEQGQRILVLQSKEALETIREITPSAYNAPVVLVICADEDVTWKRHRDSWCAAPIDTSIVCCHMMLEAQSLGLGSVWVCAFDPEKVKVAFNLPENVVPYSLLPLGYQAQDCQPNPRHFERFDIDHFVKYY